MKSAVTVWVLLGIALALSLRVATDHWSFTSVIPVGLWAVAGATLGAMLLIQMLEKERRKAAKWQGVAMIVTVVLFGPTAKVGSRLTERLRFLRERPRYDGVVAQIATDPSLGTAISDSGTDYIVDVGPPVRVAFPWPGSSSDVWCGVVYDPSGEVMERDLQVGSGAMASVDRTWVIEGRTVPGCQRINPPYYLCCPR